MNRVHSFFLYDVRCEFCRQAEELAVRLGFVRVAWPEVAELAIAPRLNRKLDRSEFQSPAQGTLIFHPSALPYRRGPDAIRQAVAADERVSAATWFWCDDGLDTGPICEQEVVLIARCDRPIDAYRRRFIPAGLRALERALLGVRENRPRRVPQDESLATYDGWLPRPSPPD